MSDERRNDDRDPAESYLWDRSGDPEPELARLERALEPLRVRGDLPLDALPDRPSVAASPKAVPLHRRRGRIVALASALALAAAVVAFVCTRPHGGAPTARGPEADAAVPSSDPLIAPEPPIAVGPCGSGAPAEGMRFASVEGAPRCDGAPAAASGVLPQGTWLETDDATRVRLEVADLGRVEVDRRSRLRVLETGKTGHRLELARGRLEATIDAPPRLFFVSTKAATAVDLGCAYELTVDDDGAGLLRVATGYVELEPVTTVWGAEPPRLPSLVPAGAECSIDPARGPGIPVWSGADAEVRSAVHRLDADPADGTALDALFAQLGKRDTLALVHLLERVPDIRREDVLVHLEAIVPAPPGASREKTLMRDPSALGAWRKALAPRWLSRGK